MIVRIKCLFEVDGSGRWWVCEPFRKDSQGKGENQQKAWRINSEEYAKGGNKSLNQLSKIYLSLDSGSNNKKKPVSQSGQ